MRHITGFIPRLFFLAALLAAPLAHAQSTPQQIQSLIASGQEPAALASLNQILQTHPDSGVAWYLTAEAQDASGNESAARSALAKAEQFSPGLPFANPNDVASLQAHLADAPAPRAHGFGPTLPVILGFIALFILIRLFMRSRRIGPVYQPAYGGGLDGGFRGPTGGMGYGPGPGYGAAPGMGSSLLSGLAAGAGFAAGERIIDDVIGNRPNPGFDPGLNQGFDPGFDQSVPSRDDGLQGNPGWDDDSNQNDSGSDFDPNNSW
jgi:hypothetical protein